MIAYTYNENNDILYIYEEEEVVRGSLDIFPGFVVDVNHQKKVVGLEIMDASEVFNIPKKRFEYLKSLKLTTILSNNYYGFVFSAKIKNKEITKQVSAPLKVSNR